jgi:predicted secreted hydrolase
MLGISDPQRSRFYSARISAQGGTAGSTADGLPAIDAGDSDFIWDPADNLYVASTTRTSDGTRISVEMDMRPTKEILAHGQDGYIPMGDGIPSGYYSLTNLLPTQGTLAIGDRQYTITGGRIWMDRQWGDWTGAGYAWDWFSMRFDDGGALMVFQFRNARDEAVRGNWTYRDVDGQVTYGTDLHVVAKRTFGRYPVDWTVTLPSLDAEFDVSPLFDDQTFTGLWEGLCDVRGRVGSTELDGQAFVELSAY